MAEGERPATGVPRRTPRRRATVDATPVLPLTRTVSGVDSETLPERSTHDPNAPPRPGRRRRSATRLPALVAPVEMPEDAPGRIELIVIRAPEDRDEPLPETEGMPAPVAARRRGPLASLPVEAAGWVAVSVLGVLLIAAFLVGIAVTR